MSESLIYESKKSRIYLHKESEWGVPVAVKILNIEYPSPTDIEHFYNEFEIIENLDLNHARKALKRTRDQTRHAMYLEWYDGQTIKSVFKNKQGDLLDFLQIAISLCDAIHELHQHNIIHKDLSPSNVLVNLRKHEVKIIDFGISAKFDLKQHHAKNPELLEGTLAYISPEQTGRMNRTVDYRTDLYSLGVILYEMVTGVLPFDSEDAMEMIHSHLAKNPAPADQVNAAVPKQIARILDILLAKKAEDRYQSAIGLKSDFERCLLDLQRTGDVQHFKLGQNDYSGRFTLPQKLYGRQREIDLLINAFDHCALGDLSTVLVAGYSGTGKSVLVHEVHKPITARRGYFIEGKFDQYQRSTPYYAIIEAFKELVDILLTKPEESLKEISTKIQESLGSEGKVLTNVIPNLELIIGEQVDIPELGGAESQNRFNYVIRKFIKVISTREHPLVIFIDDLQWADSASLGLFKTMMTDRENKYLLAIGAYRNNEVSDSHPLMLTIKEMVETGSSISNIEIENLKKQDVEDLIRDALSIRDASANALVELVYKKTQGNAFFVTQFLKSLYDDQLLTFDFDTKSWKWNIKSINEKNISDNVVELVSGNIKKLPSRTQRSLKFGACIGNTFDLETLSHIEGQDPLLLEKNLYEGLKEGLIVPVGSNRIKFSHDRIQQAVYSLIPENERSGTHHDIGKLLLERIPKQEREDRLFDIVNQWNLALDVITEKERKKVARLNLKAGHKGKSNSAFDTAFDYFKTGISLLPDDPWKSDYELCLELYTEATGASYLIGKVDLVEGYFKEISENAHDILEKVKPYEVRIHAYKANNNLLAAIDTGLEVLAQLGERFPKNPNMLHVFRDLILTALRLRGKDDEMLLSRPEMVNPEKKAAVRILADIMPSVYWATPNLVPVLVFRMVKLSLKYGNSPVSAFAYGSYGVLMCGVLEFMNMGYRFGTLAIKLLDKLNAKEWKAQIYVTTYALILFWKDHIKNTLPPLQDSFHIGLETGAIEFACVNTNIYCIHSYLCGKPLKRLEEEARTYSESFRDFKQMTNFYYNEVYRQSMLNFMGQSEDPRKLIGTAYDEEKRMAQNLEHNDQTGTFFVHFNKLILCYHFRDFKSAAKHAVQARKLLDAVLAKFEIPNLLFYEALNHLAIYEQSSGRQGSLGRVRKNRNKLKKWAKFAPDNFRHRYILIHAELLRIKGDFSSARPLYDQAIAGASANEYLNDEALGCELAGSFYVMQASDRLASYYLKLAYNKYMEWGADAKLRQLEERYPDYISGMKSIPGLFETTTSKSISSEYLDITTVLKASTSISSEVVLSKLLAKLMVIMIENAGAQRGSLMLEFKDELYVEAYYDAVLKESKVLQHEGVDNSETVSLGIVSYVKRTKETIIIQNASEDKRYKNDKYILKNKPQSIICLPIINQGKFLGLIYLEHMDISDVFNRSRSDLLSLLSGQIAVSIDNAILYRQLEQKVEERTADLANEKKKSDDLLYNILPEETAEELKQKGKTEPRSFSDVTVLFSDFVDFTRIAEGLSSEEIVSTVDECFSAFDVIVSKHKVEKIKTIGDSYMCSGGLPVPNSTHAVDCVNAALEFQQFMAAFNKKRKKEGLKPLFVRIGLHTGPVVAGVVGTKKFAYDIWGDTVNTASRMESSSEPGHVNISKDTYELVKDQFNCTFRGKIEAKNKGQIEMYFVESPKS